jgi:hypothetical protein
VKYLAVNELLAVILRGVVIPLYVAMIVLFYNKYKEDKNKFFLGYIIFFSVAFIIQAGVFLVDLGSYIGHPMQMDLLSTNRFDDYTDEKATILSVFDNFVRPSYIVIFIIVGIAIASQIHPLEIFSQYNRHFMSKGLIICAFLMSFLFIPLDFFRYSYLTMIIISLNFLFIGFGLLVNFFVSLKLYFKSVGEIRRRTLFILLGFIMYLAGMIWAARSGWAKTINSNWDFEEDVILGSIVSIISILFYYIGFKSRE